VTPLGRRVRAKLIPRQATIVSRTDLAGALVDTWCIGQTPFQPGDVLAVRVAGLGPGPTGVWRRYTISETNGHRFRLIIQRNPGGAAGPFIDTVTTGDTVTIRGPARAVLPPVGDGPLLAVSDLTGLATIAALTHQARRDGRAEQIGVAVFSANKNIDLSIVASCLGDSGGAPIIHRHLDDIASWVRQHSGFTHDSPRLLAIGEHGLTALAERTALAVGFSPKHVKTRTYWNPGRRGLE
jgi:NADPH-dependent ferric siderophore reductase